MSVGLTLHQGDCRSILPTLADESVHCVVTSPPYWGLRDYGTALWEGGDSSCQHVVGEMRRGKNLAASKASTRGGGKKAARVEDIRATGQCPHCGAVRLDSQLGLEATPAEYITSMTAVFREIRRVLRKDGTLWLNMGDCYHNGDKGGAERTTTGKQNSNRGTVKGLTANRLWQDGLKPKDLVGMPWRLAFALQADGWYLRSDIIWAKPNPMPESVRDRPTKSHEYIFLLSKSERYYYDADAIDEPVSDQTHLRISQDLANQIGSDRANGGTRPDRPMKAVLRKQVSGWDMREGATHQEKTGRYKNPQPVKHGINETPKIWKGSIPGRNGGPGQDRRSKKDRSREEQELRTSTRMGHGPGWRAADLRAKSEGTFSDSACLPVALRNKRDVWTVNPQPFAEAHFATFPEDLIKPCILAGCPEGGTVLDPFYGAGTTGLVGRALGCNVIGIELSAKYVKIAAKRLSQEVLQFPPELEPLRTEVEGLAEEDRALLVDAIGAL